jgi:hypothetical protein
MRRSPAINRWTSHLWPLGEYRDVDCGNLLQRSAAFRHNRELARRLPAYINRWALISGVLLILTQVVPGRIGSFFGVMFAVAFCGALHLGHLWLLFRRLS